MKRKIFLALMANILILSAILSFLPLKVGATSSMKIVGYVAGDDPHGYINSLEYTKYTHLIFCQIGVTSTTDPTLVYRAGNSTSLKSFKTKAQAAGCKFMVCLIGGNWGQEPYPYPLTAIMNNSTYRAQLATNLANFVAANGLDGVDIDWEDDNIVQANYNSFLSSLRSALPAGKIISVCGTAEWANPSNQWFSVSAVNNYVDFVNLMMYGTHPYPEWSKLADAETYTQEWLNAGFNPAQLLLGITTQAIDSTRKATDYSNVVANLNPTNDVDSYTQTPPWSCGSFTVGGTGELWWGGYNLAQSKADYASSKNLGGIALYVANEDACGNVKSLIDAVVQGGINGNTPPPPVQSNPAQSNFGYGSTGVYNNGDTNCMFFSSDMPSSNGVATSVTVYVANYGANAKVKCALYNASTLALVGTTEEKTISNTGPLTLNFTSSPPVIAGTKYLIVWWSNGVYFAGRYDMGAPNNTGGYEYVPYGTWPSTLALPNYQPAYYSIYCTYTQGDINSNPAQSNFGYGSTGVYNNGDANCMFFGSDIPSSNGVATSVTVYVASYGANAKVKCALYNASTLALVGTTEEKTIIKTGPLTLNFTNAPPVKAGTKYLIVWWSNGVYFAGRYDMGAPNNTGGYEYATYGNWPGTLAVPNYQPAYYSVYCTYNLTP